MSIVWEVDKDSAFEQRAFTDEPTTVCLDYLRRLNHTVTVAPLSRFFGHALAAGTEDGADKRARDDLRGAIKACAAFTALWRGAFGTTANIDAIYRALMSEGDGTTALAAEPKGRKGAVSLQLLKAVLKAALAREKIDTRSRWASKVKSTPLYRQSRPTVFFLISAAAKDAVADNTDHGLPKLGRSGVNDTLSSIAWQQLVEMEVEHVAPQSGSGGTWGREIYDDGDLVHTLGNLTLLCKEQNIVMSDHTWAKKRLGFKALSATTHEAFEAVRREAMENDLSLPAKGEAVLASSAYAPLLVPIAEKATDWDADFIEQRSVRLAELAWDQLYPWLQ